MTKAIVGGRVITMAGPVHDPGYVLLDRGRILAVGDLAELEMPDGAEVIDAAGRVIMPGLVEAHCHVGILEEIYREEGDDTNEISDPVTPQLRAIDAINPEDLAIADARRGGVTTIGVGPGSANAIGGENLVMKTHPAATMEELVVLNPSGLKMALGENPKRIYSAQQKAPRTRMATAALIRQTLVSALNYMKKPEADRDRDLKLEPMVRALKRESRVHIHAHRSDDIMTAVRIAEEFGLDLVMIHGTEGHKIAGELAQRGIPVVVGPTLGTRAKVELKDKSFKTPSRLLESGVKVALMTDHPVIPIQYLCLCAALAVKEGMPEEEALKAITINAAEILGVDRRVGSLEPGKDADILVLSGSILEVATQVEKVFIGGEQVV
ncbi:MAG: amidohydrolase [Firmicutes bacterium]|nr:amidohydrolase [Bacillota bacterium]